MNEFETNSYLMAHMIEFLTVYLIEHELEGVKDVGKLYTDICELLLKREEIAVKHEEAKSDYK